MATKKSRTGATQEELEARYSITADQAAKNAGFIYDEPSGDWIGRDGRCFPNALDVCTHCLCW